jgi:hypothetical protein
MSRQELVRQYGVEIVLKCSCGEVPSHFMEGHTPRCPLCKELTKIVVKNHDGYYPLHS